MKRYVHILMTRPGFLPALFSFPTIQFNSSMSELSGSIAAHLIDILGEFPAGRIHLAKAEEHFIRTLVKMIRDECLKLLYLLLHFRRYLVIYC